MQNQTFFNAFNNLAVDPLFDPSAFNKGSMAAPPNFVLAAMPAGYTAFDLSSIAADEMNLVSSKDGRALVATDYAGAVAPGTSPADAWYAGWTVWADDGSDSRPNQDGN